MEKPKAAEYRRTPKPAVFAKSHMRLRVGVRQYPAAFILKIQWQPFRILDAVLHFDEESDGFFSVDCAMIVT